MTTIKIQERGYQSNVCTIEDALATYPEIESECDRRGFFQTGFLGYYRLGNTNTRVSVLNAGPRRRDQLAYLIREHARAECRQEGNVVE